MIAQFKTWLIRRRVYRQTYKELNSLTNHQLSDLGLNRGSIEQIAFESAYGREARYV
jgi:uncharacterized protein YjiS (DUF1127 family)